MKRDKPGRSSLAELAMSTRPPGSGDPDKPSEPEPPPGERPTVPAGKRVPPDTHHRVKAPDPIPEAEVRDEAYAASRVPSSRPPPSKESDRYLGVTIDNRYRIEEVIGEGGMGVVYRCRHKVIDKVYAIKILRSDFASDHEATERFMNEAKAASAIGNVHIVDVIDFGDLPDESTYFVMEYLDGQPLSQFMGGEPLPIPLVIHLASQIAEALQAAHRVGIIHRDLKPDNVYVVRRDEEEHFIKILDFGIAKIAGRQNKITRAGTIFGTPHYMSPEQAKGSPADQRTDLYSLGIILYEMVTGRVPFDAESPMGILSQHLNDPPPPIFDFAPTGLDLPSGLEEIIRRCLEKEPEGRYASMEELLGELDRVAAGELPRASTSVPPPPRTRGRAGASGRPPPMARAVRSDPAPAMTSPDHALSLPVSPPISVTPPARLSEPAPKGPSTSEPRRRSVWPYLVALLSLAAGVAVAMRFMTPPPRLGPPADKGLAQIVDQAGSGAVERFRMSMVEAPLPKPPAPDLHSVAMVLSPIDSEVFLDGVNLGMMPVNVTFEKDRVVDIIVRRRGFQPQIITLDKTISRMVVQLNVLDPSVDPASVEPEVGVGKPDPSAPPPPITSSSATGPSAPPAASASATGAPPPAPSAPKVEPPKPPPTQEPPKDPTPPSTAPPKTAPPKTAPPKTEPPKPEPPSPAPPKTEAPKTTGSPPKSATPPPAPSP